jgi:general L-amino acid transport system permease protein
VKGTRVRFGVRRLRRVAVQLVFLVAIGGMVAWLGSNLSANLRRLGFSTDYSFLSQPAGFDIAGSDFDSSSTVLEAMRVGTRNTIQASAVGIVLATALGLTVGICRLSPNWLLRRLGTMFVETFRNVPVLVIILFMYLAVVLKFPPIEQPLRPLGLAVVSNRGIWLPAPLRGFVPLVSVLVLGAVVAAVVTAALARRGARRRGLAGGGILLVALIAAWASAGAGLSVPQQAGRVVTGGIRVQAGMVALVAGLVLYTSTHIGELVRASIQAVPKGQGEAAEALGLSSSQRLRLVVIPQALRIMVPPLANQYLNLTKNSSLGVAVGFAELTLVTRVATSSASPAPQAISVLMGVYLALSLLIAAATNLLNRRLLAAGQR